jgi:hypothetical protein
MAFPIGLLSSTFGLGDREPVEEIVQHRHGQPLALDAHAFLVERELL